jgi:anti-anti-sigma factor
MQNQVTVALQNNRLFRNTNISGTEIDSLQLNFFTLDEGEILYNQDDTADSIYLVLEGEINLIKRQSFGKTRSVFEENDFFGQDELFLNIKRNSMAVARKESHIAELNKDDLEFLIYKHNSIFDNIKMSLTGLDAGSIRAMEELIEKNKSGSSESLFDLQLENKSEKENEPDYPEADTGAKKISRKINLNKIEVEINNLVTELNEKILQVEKEKNKKQEEIKKLKLQESKLIEQDKEKNQILGQQSYKIIELEKNIRNLESKYSKEIKSLSNQIKEYQTSLQRTEQKLEDNETLIASKDEIISEMKEQEQYYQKRIREDSDSIIELKRSISDNKKKQAELDNIIKDQEIKIKDLEEKLNILTKDIVNRDKNLKELNKELSEKDIFISDLTKKTDEVTSENERLTAALNESMKGNEEALRKLENLLAQKENEIKDLTSLLSQKQSESENFQKSHNEFLAKEAKLNEEISNLSIQTAEVQKKYDELSGILAGKDNYITQQNNEIESLRSELKNRIENNKNNYTRQIEELSQALANKQSEIDNLMKMTEDFTDKETRLNAEISTLTSQLIEANRKSEQLSAIPLEKEKLIEEQEKVIQEKEKVVEEKEKVVEEKEKVVEEKEKENRELNSKLQELSANIEAIKNIVVEKEQAIRDLENTVNEMRDELTNNPAINELEEKLKKEQIDTREITEKYESTLREKEIVIEDYLKQLENVRLAKAEILKVLNSTKKSSQENLEEKENQILELSSELNNIRKNLEEKMIAEKQKADLIENQAQKISSLELLIEELNAKNLAQVNEADSKDNMVIEEISVQPETIEEIRSEPEVERLSDINDILSRSKFIASESVNPHEDDKSYEHLEYMGVSIVNLNVSRATMELAASFGKFLTNIVNKNHKKIVVNLAPCEFFDSTILGVLVNNLKKARAVKGDLRIVWTDDSEYSLIHITKMNGVFKIFNNLDDAVKSYL